MAHMWDTGGGGREGESAVAFTFVCREAFHYLEIIKWSVKHLGNKASQKAL